MQPLEKTLRNRLENTVKIARNVAEEAARAALEQLGVGDASLPQHLDNVGRELRRCLRVHGRQLGDMRNAVSEVQETDRLLEEIAYEHWHRMLFARFLAENNLLMYPDPDAPVAVTLEECDDLAADEGAANGWELAARFAARMLPQIFRIDSPVFQLSLAPEYQQKLEKLLIELPVETFTASDSLGWVYQFWQADNKDRINKSEVKIGARELPAVTQLFTEPYMVSFLLDNSLGAWWVKTQATSADSQIAARARKLLISAASENELREFFALSGAPLEYLRFVRSSDCLLKEGDNSIFAEEHWMPAAGWFSGWPGSLAELKTLDPCCGSGHFLVAALLMLVPMRMQLEKISAKDAADRVLKENLHGLELDQRCVELAAFALALTAWKYPSAGGYRQLPELNVACSGLSVSVAKEEWKKLAFDKKDLQIAMSWMYDTFTDAPVLGSLLNPARADATKIVAWPELSSALEQALNQEQNEEQHEVAVVAHGLARAAVMLAEKYSWVITNVPYLSRGKQSDTTRDFCEKYYNDGKSDLATVFLERCLEFCTVGGTANIVLPQNWLFLTSYKKFRENLLKNHTWHLIARLGPGAFETISGEVVKAILINISHGNRNSAKSGLFATIGAAANHLLRGLDVSEFRTAAEKAANLLTTEIKAAEQAKQLENPDARVALAEGEDGELLNCISYSFHGLTSGDMPRMKFNFWEIVFLRDVWLPFQGTVNGSSLFSGNETILRWQNGQGAISELQGARKDGTGAWGSHGILVSQMQELPVTLYNQFAFDNNTAVIIPNNQAHLTAIWCFCSSPEYNEAVRRIDQKLNVTSATLGKVPFDLEYWTKVGEEKYPNSLPNPYTDDLTQRLFHGHPCGSVVWDETKKWTAHAPMRTDETVLQVAVARLLGYRWPAELDKKMELADEQREWVKRCDALLKHIDDDGIVCIPPVRGEAAAADRLLNLLADAYSAAWSNDVMTRLLASADHAGKTLETWLRDKFFTQHCKMFQHRPFIWHIWDGLRDGFSALVNYHKLDYKTLETLIYTYLGDWVARQKQDLANGIDGAAEKLAAAENLKKRLELILEGEAPYDIFVRWKPLNKQPIGWNPDLNDGVRLNIRPFMSVTDIAKKGAGVLRDKPNIKWEKDRGKDVASAPWYNLGTQYAGNHGDRINDHHLTLKEKTQSKK